MKMKALILIASLLLLTPLSYAASDNASSEKVEVNKLQNQDPGHSRSIGRAVADKNKASEYNSDKKRIKELEELVKEQEKLIELYKKKNNTN